MTSIMKISILAASLLLVAVIGGCEDTPPNAYTAEYIVEGYLVVDEPIGGIRLTLSQSVADTFRAKNGIVSDADVRVIAGGRAFLLQYSSGSSDSVGSYTVADTSLKVEPNTLYTLEIRTKDGKVITAQTATPGRVSWVREPKDTVTIPPKSDPGFLKPPDSLRLSWTDVAGVPEYLISVRALDTLDYGRYLPSPIEKANRRVDPDLDDQFPRYNDLTRWGFLAGLSTPIVWSAFKWYGPQEVAIWAADDIMIKWFKMTYWQGNPQYDPLLGNVRGDGIGVFASASVARKQMFVVMTDR